MNTAIEGINRLYEYGGLVIVLVFQAFALGLFIKHLIARNDALADKIISVTQDNTRVLSMLTEKIDALTKND